ncbi:hypothetical protein CDL12_13438 [Handroanthus impetiginosus]|uniref:Uncharacterized protein n=1 Tax=Handroanthus impetiginosus TaxID=429701 RepID=A0A2G9H8U4_9LAMI|nr:hypothetical protein CDL12_13438 [Handroanthus impetiginosus]
MEEPSTLELKHFPNHPRYVYLGEFDTLSVIILSLFFDVQVEKLLRMLKEHKADIIRISCSFCMHKILFEDDHKASMKNQRRLNPIMKEVVKKQIIKWLDTLIIYHIYDSLWVSAIQYVSKKGE